MEISNRMKITLLVIILTVIIVGITVGGPKFINKMQMHFGFKGKIELIEQCIDMPGCAISTDELDLYKNYRELHQSEAGKKLKQTDLVKELDKEQQKELDKEQQQ